MQEKILGDIRNREQGIVLLRKWVGIIKINKIFRIFKKEVKRKSEEAEYFQKVMWTVIRARVRM